MEKKKREDRLLGKRKRGRAKNHDLGGRLLEKNGKERKKKGHSGGE